MENKSSGRQSIGLVSILGVVFIVLKLCGVINWSWWWVLAPFWGQLVVGIIILVVILIIAIIKG